MGIHIKADYYWLLIYSNHDLLDHLGFESSNATGIKHQERLDTEWPLTSIIDATGWGFFGFDLQATSVDWANWVNVYIMLCKCRSTDQGCKMSFRATSLIRSLFFWTEVVKAMCKNICDDWIKLDKIRLPFRIFESVCPYQISVPWTACGARFLHTLHT